MEQSLLVGYATGLQHVGIPTNDINATISFYKGLGFDLIYHTRNEAADEDVAFLQLKDLVIETYQNREATLRNGAVDHLAIDVKNIHELFDKVCLTGYTLITDTIQSLPFWENGIKYFIIEGPNKEKLEFCERL